MLNAFLVPSACLLTALIAESNYYLDSSTVGPHDNDFGSDFMAKQYVIGSVTIMFLISVRFDAGV